MEGIEGHVVIGLSVVVLVWYFLGQQAMRRRGLFLLQQARAVVPILGESPKLRWLGTSAFQLTVERPAHPFKALVLTVVLEPREIIFLWLVNRFRQRRDLMVVRGDFVARPPAMGELFRAEGAGGKEAHAEAISERWPIAPFDANGLQLAPSSPILHEALLNATQSLHTQLSSLLRLSIRDTSPHLLLNYTLRPGHEGNIGDVFRCLLDLACALLPTHPA
jgi:hypothetical protein